MPRVDDERNRKEIRMSRPRKEKLQQIDQRTPHDTVRSIYSSPEGQQKIVDVFQGLGIDLTHDHEDSFHPFNKEHAAAKQLLAINESSIALLNETPNSLPACTAADETAAKRLLCVNKLLIDPLNEEPIFALMLAQLAITPDDDVFRSSLGNTMVEILEKCTADETEVLFKRIVTLKRNAEQPPHRNCYAFAAYNNFIFETGIEPTKRQLRKYMIARLEEYRDQPEPGNPKGWTRLWKDSGLFKLPER
jgi:hypothetical protein